MKVLCHGNRGSHLPPEKLAKSGNTPYSIFHVTIGRTYQVHAMALWSDGLGVLVVNDLGKTSWEMVDLFEVVDNTLPGHWRFRIVKDYDPLLALWGYPSLIEDPNHYEDLIERVPSARDVFLRETGHRPSSGLG